VPWPEHTEARAYALNAKHGQPISNDIRDQMILELRQGTDGHDPMIEQEIAEAMGIAQQRASQVLVNLLGASNFTTDKPKVREAIRRYLRGGSFRSIAEKGLSSH